MNRNVFVSESMFVDTTATVVVGDNIQNQKQQNKTFSDEAHGMEVENEQQKEDYDRPEESFVSKQQSQLVKSNNEVEENKINSSQPACESEKAVQHTTDHHQSVKKSNVGGVNIDVSPGGSFLAWFKNLAIPSPASSSRWAINSKIKATHEVNENALHNSSLINLEFNSHSSRQRTCETSHLNSNIKDDSQPLAQKLEMLAEDPLRSDSLLSEASATLASTTTRKTNGSTQSTAADSTISGQSHNKTDNETNVWSKIKIVLKSFIGKVNHSICILIEIVKQKIKTIKKHPKIFTGIIVLILLLILFFLLLVFLVIIPHKIQNVLDQTILDLAHATITDPTYDSFMINVESRIERALGTPVTLKAFQATVRYAPTSEFEKLYQNILNKTTAAFQRSKMNEKSGMYYQNQHIKESERRINQFRDQYQSIGPISTISSFSTSYSPFTLSSLIPLDKINTRGRQLQEKEFNISEDNNFKEYSNDKKKYYDLGQMKIPDQTIFGFSFMSSYTSRYEILDSDLFAVFLHELLKLGHSDWVIVGHPAIRIMGLTFYGSLFEKAMPVHGPVLHITEAEFIKSLLEKENSEFPDSQVWWKKHQARQETQKQEVTSSPKSSPSNSPQLKISLVNLTLSTPDVTRLHLKVKMNNTDGLATIDPIGAMTILIKYKRQPIIELKSTDNTILKPGFNTIHFFGQFTRIDQGGLLRQVAFTELLTSVFRNESPILESSGVTCSVPLFTPAIEMIHLYTPITIIDKDSNYNSDNASEIGLPILRQMKVETLKLIQHPSKSSEVSLMGDIVAVIENPLGPDSLMEIPQVTLNGSMLMPQDKQLMLEQSLNRNDSTESFTVLEKKTIAQFKGTLKGKAKTFILRGNDGSPLLSQIGVMPTSLQQIHFEMDLSLNLTNNGLTFQEFVQAYVHKKHLSLSMHNVSATLETQSALGSLTLKDIPMDKDLQLVGFNGLKGVVLEDFLISSVPIISSSEVKGFGVSCSVMIPSAAAANIYLGTVFVDLKHQDRHLVYLDAPKCRIAPGKNYFNFTGTAKLSDMDSIMSFLKSFVGGGLSETVQVEIVKLIPDQQSEGEVAIDEAIPEWLSKALVGVTLEVNVRGNRFRNAMQNAMQNAAGLIGFALFGGNRTGIFGRNTGNNEQQAQQNEQLAIEDDGLISGMSIDNQRQTGRTGGQMIGSILNNVISGLNNMFSS